MPRLPETIQAENDEIIGAVVEDGCDELEHADAFTAALGPEEPSVHTRVRSEHADNDAHSTTSSSSSDDASPSSVPVAAARLAVGPMLRPSKDCTVHAGTQRRVAIPDSARQASEDRRGGNDRSVH